MGKRKLKIGDHLVVNRIGYDHHGIYIGEEKVIHYSGSPSNLKNAIIEETSLDKFIEVTIAGETFPCKTLIKEEKYGKFSRKEVVKRAKSRIGERQYNLITNNCETFCNWCITGQNKSNQVTNAVESFFRHILQTKDSN